MRAGKAIVQVALPVLILALMAGYIHIRNIGTGRRVEPIAMDEIASMTVMGLPERDTAACGREEIEAFVSAYNRARYYRDDVGTTPPMGVEIVFSDGTKMLVWGGTQGFQTMKRDGAQHNIKGAALDAWFRQYD